MALNNITNYSIQLKPSSSLCFLITNNSQTSLFYRNPFSCSLLPNHLSSSSYSSIRVAAQSEGQGELTEEGYISSARTQLDLLEQLTSTSSYIDGNCNEGESAGRPTIRYQLLQLVGDREGEDFSIPLGKDLKKVSKRFLTVSQKRNIKRQTYLNDVSKRNDTVFFSTIAAFVILPPILILMVAVITGNVQLLP